MKKILILGVNGFIGHHLSKRILATTDWDVYGMDMNSEQVKPLPASRHSVRRPSPACRSSVTTPTDSGRIAVPCEGLLSTPCQGWRGPGQTRR